MNFDGKRTARLELPEQLRSDPDLAESVRFIARANRRTIQLQILEWIVIGVENDRNHFRQSTSGDGSFASRVTDRGRPGPVSARGRQRQEKSA